MCDILCRQCAKNDYKQIGLYSFARSDTNSTRINFLTKLTNRNVSLWSTRFTSGVDLDFVNTSDYSYRLLNNDFTSSLSSV